MSQAFSSHHAKNVYHIQYETPALAWNTTGGDNSTVYAKGTARQFDTNWCEFLTADENQVGGIFVNPPGEQAWAATADRIGCTHTVLASGHWVASGQPPNKWHWKPEYQKFWLLPAKRAAVEGPLQFAAMMTPIVKRMQQRNHAPGRRGTAFLRTINYVPLGYPQVSHGSPNDHGPGGWRNPMIIQAYNAELHLLAKKHAVPMIDLDHVMLPIWDTSNDFNHPSGGGFNAEADEVFRYWCHPDVWPYGAGNSRTIGDRRTNVDAIASGPSQLKDFLSRAKVLDTLPLLVAGGVHNVSALRAKTISALYTIGLRIGEAYKIVQSLKRCNKCKKKSTLDKKNTKI
jgi:hypothetical protein